MVQLRLNVELKSRPPTVMKTNLNDQVTLVTAKVLAVKVWNKEMPSRFGEGSVIVKDVQLTFDETIPANVEGGETNQLNFLWSDIKRKVKLHKMGKQLMMFLPKIDKDLLNQVPDDLEHQKPDEAFAARIAPMLCGATIKFLSVEEKTEVTLESGEIATKMLYKRALAGAIECKKFGVKPIEGNVVEPTLEYKLRAAENWLLEERKKRQLKDKADAKELGKEYVEVDYFKEELEVIRKKFVVITIGDLL